MIDEKKTAGLRPAVFEAGENAQRHNPPNTLPMQALRYAERGWPVFPLQPNGKIPITTHGYKDASTDKEQIAGWWKEHPNANIGVTTGTVSGFFVLDIDGEDGEQSLKKLEETHGPLPPTGETITGGGGRHLFFKVPEGCRIRNSAGKIADKIDIRGDGGYIVVPPSIHASGRPYAFSVDSHNQMALPPDWLMNLMCKDERASSTGGGNPLEGIEHISEGKRNSTLTSICGHLLSKRVSPALCLALCTAANRQFCQPPLHDQEVRQIVNSIAGREIAKLKGTTNAK